MTESEPLSETQNTLGFFSWERGGARGSGGSGM